MFSWYCLISGLSELMKRTFILFSVVQLLAGTKLVSWMEHALLGRRHRQQLAVSFHDIPLSRTSCGISQRAWCIQWRKISSWSTFSMRFAFPMCPAMCPVISTVYSWQHLWWMQWRKSRKKSTSVHGGRSLAEHWVQIPVEEEDLTFFSCHALAGLETIRGPQLVRHARDCGSICPL